MKITMLKLVSKSFIYFFLNKPAEKLQRVFVYLWYMLFSHH